jgi:hypothetical protein
VRAARVRSVARSRAVREPGENIRQARAGPEGGHERRSLIHAASVTAVARELHDVAGVAGKGPSTFGQSIGHFCRIGFGGQFITSNLGGVKGDGKTMKRLRNKLLGLLRRKHTPSQARVDDYHERVERVRRNSRRRMSDSDTPINLGDESPQ